MKSKRQRPALLAAAHWLGPCPTCKAEAKYNLAERPTKCRMCGEVIPDARTFQQRKNDQYATRNWA